MKQIFQSTPFYFIRHGETHWNNERRIMGQKDIPLNQKGIEQAQKAAETLKNKAHLKGAHLKGVHLTDGHFTLILSSPLI